jgi:hypothetical protein
MTSLAGSSPNLANLILSHNFNKDISNLSGSFFNLTNLHLGCYFNKDISNIYNISHYDNNL